jgi:signal transduction histidine kinase
MHQGSRQFGVRATSSFKRSFNQSLLKLSFLYGTILVAILFISGLVTFDEFSSRIGRRFKDVQPTITIQLPNGDVISNKPFFATQTMETIGVAPGNAMAGAGSTSGTNAANGQQRITDRTTNGTRPMLPTAEDIRQDLVASLIFVNGILLLLASLASYLLARLTLRPIRDSYERQRRFLGDASHELRTPLSILQIELENELHAASGANAASSSNSAKAAAQREQILSKLEEVKRMSKLVSDLLAISRLDEDRHPKASTMKKISKADFIKSIEKITSRLSPLAESRSVSIKFYDKTDSDKSSQSEDSKGFSISLDEEMFSHALTNLIQNAVFYNKKDGTVDVSVRNERKKAVVEIRDSGIGISKPDLERIFDRFYRADKSRTRKNIPGIPDEGSGLGLSIAKSALLYMGGNLEIQSEPNVGTIVHVELKAA